MPGISRACNSTQTVYFFTRLFQKCSAMNLPKVVIKDNYADFLEGKEVEATIISNKQPVEKGMHVMGFHNSIAVNTGFTVPKEKQAHYIGVEGMVTEIDYNKSADHKTPHIKVVKV